MDRACMTSARIHSSAAIADFLNHALADGALAVAELEVKARAAGLLGERQQIQHAKAFKKAKKSLGIQSRRDGFGVGGKWVWLLPAQSVPLTTDGAVEPDFEAAEKTHSGPIARWSCTPRLQPTTDWGPADPMASTYK